MILFSIFDHQLETRPAGIELVIVGSGWNPSSSDGIPNWINLASYTLIASLYAFVAWFMLYWRFFICWFLNSMESFTLDLIYSMESGGNEEFCINWCNWASFCSSCYIWASIFLINTLFPIYACLFTYLVSDSNLWLSYFFSTATLSYLSVSSAIYLSILATF